MGSDTSMALKKTGGIVTRILHKWGMGLHGVVTVFAIQKSDGIVIRILHLGGRVCLGWTLLLRRRNQVESFSTTSTMLA